MDDLRSPALGQRHFRVAMEISLYLRIDGVQSRLCPGDVSLGEHQVGTVSLVVSPLPP